MRDMTGSFLCAAEWRTWSEEVLEGASGWSGYAIRARSRMFCVISNLLTEW